MSHITEAELDAVEETLGVCLPENYRSLLTSLTANAHGYSTTKIFSLSLIVSADGLIRENSCWDFRIEDWDLDLDEEVEGFFVIGNDGCGNNWLIDPDEDDSPVFFLEHDPEGFSEKIPSITELVRLYLGSG